MAPRFLHIAAGVLRNAHGEVLICQRPAHKLYPGEWEFPGGKVEPGETVEQALARELHEELGIRVMQARPLIRLRHAYPELSVDLDTWLVERFDGVPLSTEHPAVEWVAPAGLPHRPLLAADRPIVQALRLPWHCVFTPPAGPAAALPSALPALPRGSLLRLRRPGLDAGAYATLARQLAAPCRALGLALVLDRDPADAALLGAAGWHATAAVLGALDRRPVPSDLWFGASCHDAADLARARDAGADYAVLGPVRATPTHPGTRALAWDGFAQLARGAGLPVYAIGGVGPADLPVAWTAGAQGVAGISAYGPGLPAGASGSSGSAGTE